MEDKLQKLKAEAYDLLAFIEEAKRQLAQKNSQIVQLTTQLQQPQIVTEQVEG